MQSTTQLASVPTPACPRFSRTVLPVAVALCLAQVPDLRSAALAVPPTSNAVPIAVPSQERSQQQFVLVDARRPDAVVPAALAPVPTKSGLVDRGTQAVVATLPLAPDQAYGRRMELQVKGDPGTQDSKRFRFSEVNDDSLLLWDGNQRVLVYNHGMMLPEGVPADRRRSTYVHPLYGLDGEVLSDDFPRDHYHHRGLFWAWPHVRVAGQHYDLWMIQGIKQRFERWLVRDEAATAATLAVESGWYVGDRKMVQERIWLRVYPVTDDTRCIDVDCYWIPVDEPLTLAGAAGKSYGGLTLRYAPRTDTVITTPLGNGSADLSMTPLAWADFSARFEGRDRFSGAALFVADDHPDYPPTWLTRHYGALCIGWPGVEAQTFPAGQPIHCRYRVWVHRDAPSPEAVQQAYDAYLIGLKLKWSE
jgi:hypothetical protein